MTRLKQVLKTLITSPPVIAVIASAVIMSITLLVHPLIGMADNGDFYRSINGQGIYKLDRYEQDQFFNYFSSQYGLYQYYNDSDSILSVQNVYIQAAKFINQIVFGNTEIFDIRSLAVIQMLEMLLVIYMLVDYITYRRSKLAGMLLAALCVFIFTDTAYIAYFNSFYAEGIVYVSFLLLVASALLLTQKRYSPYPLLASILVNGMIFIFTKQQNATEGLGLLILCVLIALFFPIGRKQFKKAALGCGALLAAGGIFMYVVIPESFIYINQYHAMTRGIMMTAPNPEDALREFGIDKQYAILDKNIYFEKYPAVDVESDLLQKEFYSKYGFVSVSIYYLTHPKQLMTMLNEAASAAYYIRPAAQGNYEREVGMPAGAQSEFFTSYSNLKKNIAPKTIGFVFLWIILAVVLSLRDKQKIIVIICTFFMGILQVGTSIVGAGDADLSKHIFLYNVAFDVISFICFAPLLVAAAGFLFRKRKKRVQKN